MAEKIPSGKFCDLIAGDEKGGSYLSVDRSGTPRLIGGATMWTDFSIPAQRTIIGALGKPDYDFTNLGLLFPQNNPDEIVYITAQMDHKKALGTLIRPHIHYIQSVAQQPTFIMEYKFYNNGEAVPGAWTTISTANGSKGIFAYSSGSIMQIARFPYVAPPANEGTSANFDFKIYRNDNDVVGDVLVKYIDFHYQIDAFGSNGEFTK